MFATFVFYAGTWVLQSARILVDDILLGNIPSVKLIVLPQRV